MIKANEIRIGNWFADFVDMKPAYIQVLSIHNTQSNGGKCDCNYVLKNEPALSGIRSFEIEYIEPIPLTPEILENNKDLKKFSSLCHTLQFDDGSIGLYHNFFQPISLDEKKSALEVWFDENYAKFVIKYVHQAQNAIFGLTGEDPEIYI